VDRVAALRQADLGGGSGGGGSGSTSRSSEWAATARWANRLETKTAVLRGSGKPARGRLTRRQNRALGRVELAHAWAGRMVAGWVGYGIAIPYPG